MKKVIASMFFLVFGLFLVGCKESISTSEYLKKTWNIDISEESIILYELDTFGGFNGDGFDYIIYELKNYDLENLTNNHFLYKTNLYKEKTPFFEFYVEQMDYIYWEIYGFNIPIEFQINENIKNYYWKYILNSEGVQLFALIDVDLNLLYIFVLKQ